MESPRKILLAANIFGENPKQTILSFLFQNPKEKHAKIEAPRKILLAANILGENPKQTILSFLFQILHHLLQIFSNAWEFLVRKFDQILPPDSRSETLNHWTHLCLTRALPVALVLLLLYCCCKCCCKCGGGARRMMKAPGRRGATMPRAAFEGNPRGYFRNLHAKKALVY